MEIRTIVTGDLQTNTYLIIDADRSEAVLVDPADDAGRILDELEKSNVTLKAILITHGHFDHIGAVDEIANVFHVPVVTHQAEAQMMCSSKANLSLAFMNQPIVGHADTFINDGDMLSFGDHLKFRCIVVPGHTYNSVCYYNAASQFVITGDTLMSGAMGRTDFCQGRDDLFIHMIETKLMCLPLETLVYPGHGFSTKIGVEKVSNPYLS